MKRKVTLILVLAVLVTAIGASAVFAHDNNVNRDENSISSMFDSMRDWVQQARDNNEITKQEANDWEDHFNDMEEYHNENGFSGHCGGSSNDEPKEQGFMGNMMSEKL